jgi:hypothetical protein
MEEYCSNAGYERYFEVCPSHGTNDHVPPIVEVKKRLD